jgi:sugar diacid utilization regulator
MSTRSLADHLHVDEEVLAHYRRILLTIRDQAGELAGQIIAAMVAEVPAYARQDESFRQEAARIVTKAALLTTNAGLEGRRLTTSDIAGSHRELAVRSARTDIPLQAYLKSFRVSQRIYWNAIVGQSDGSPAADKAVLLINTELVRYIHLISTYGAQAFLEFQNQLVADADRQRRDLVENLLAGVMPARRQLLELARAHGVGQDADLVVIVALKIGDGFGADDLYMACAALAGASVTDKRTLVAARHDEIVALAVSRSDQESQRLSAAVAEARDELARQGIDLAVGVSTIASGVGELPRGYQEARMALDLVGGKGGITALPLLSPIRYLALRADTTAWHLVDPQVRELLEDDRARGGPLVETIRAFADSDLNLRATAQRLQVHHNTAQYRLRRIQERTSRNPRHIADLMELLVAISLHRPDV